jgi:hypothetical protein
LPLSFHGGILSEARLSPGSLCVGRFMNAY